MKKMHIIGLIVIAICAAVIISTIASSATYANFNEAFSNPDRDYTISGYLNKEKPIETQPTSVTFYMIDHDGEEHKVHLNQAKPQDFERSEKVIVKGHAKGSDFYATEISLKCPSKYNDMKMKERKK
jgi:cytochrome c-type biogenesis protein CcmE